MENTKGSWKVFIAIILAGLLIAMSVLLSATLVASRIDKGSRTITKGFLQVAKSLTQAADYRRGGRGPQPKQPAPGTKTVEGVTAGTNPLKGKKEAPVLLVEFSDFQCPFSKMFYKKSMPQLEEEYIKTGKVKFAYRDFALNFHPQAKAAAAACRCAGKQKKYWEMFGKLMAGGALTPETITGYGQELKLNMKRFDKCLTGKKIIAAIEKDKEEGAKLGVGSTPVFFINGRVITGAYPFEVFKTIIEEELNKKQK